MAAPKKKAKPVKPGSTVAAVREGSRGGGRPRATLWENVKGIGGAVLIFLFLRTFLIEAYRIPSGSMIPSLLIGDWLFVNKLVYGPHIPFTKVNLPGYSEPKRYEIAVFVSPLQIDQPDDPTPTLVKRIVGLPGDTLHMRGGRLFIDGVEQTLGYGDQSRPGDPNEISFLFDWQKKYDLDASRFGPAPEQPTHDNWGPLVIPARFYFMMGDNRYESKDSRYWGIVPRENFRGRPMFVYYSWNADSDRALPALTDIRWGRLFHRIR
ncbi:MAG TPA: signal peptidase I [Gemmatimonadaceae bacterium]